jgi:chitodextrinase
MNRVSSGFSFDRDGSCTRTRAGYFSRALLAASCFALLFVAAAISLHARAAATGSDKFIPTFLIYYGNGPTLVAADASKLAKYDLLGTDRFRYTQIGPNTWAAIKAINPEAQIYLYEMGPDAPNHLDATSQLNLNGLGRHNVSRGHFMGSLNGNNPGLFLRGNSGSRVYRLGNSNPGANQFWYLMDFGATAYQSYWVAAVKADIVDQPWVADGVLADGCTTLSSNGGYNAVPSFYATNAAWSSAMNDFASSITAGLFGYGQKVWCNRGGSGTVDGASAWRALDQTASPPDVVLEEGAFAVSWGSAAVEFYSEAAWKRQIDTIGAISNSKVAVASHTKLLEGQSGTDNYGRSVSYWQALWYSLGSFLLARNDDLGNAYFMFRGGSGYNKVWWHEEYDRIDLGKAVRPYAVRNLGTVNVYWREFEKGYVYVNPTDREATSVTLPQPGRRLTRANMNTAPDSIPSVSAIALKRHQAAFVLKVAAPPPPDTTAPTVPAGLTGTAVSSSQVNLSWNASTDNVGVTGYIVYLNNTQLAATSATSFSHTGLSPSTIYNYRVSAFDAVPNHSTWTATPVAVTTPLPADTAAPSAPIGLTAVAVSSTQINLSWNASTDNRGVTGYRLYRGGALLATLGTVTTYQNTGLAVSTSYSYTVQALDAAGNASAQSAAAAATTQSTAASLAITSFLANSDATNAYYSLAYTGTATRIQLFLDTDRAAGTGFPTSGIGASHMVELGAGYGNLYRYSGTGGAWAWTLVRTVTYTNTNGVASITIARADIGSPAGLDAVAAISGSPTVFSAKVALVLSGSGVDIAAPSVPTGLVGAAVSSTQINLSWNASTDNVGVTGYRVYMNDAQLATTTGTSFSHTGLAAGATYRYRVSAYDAVPNQSAWTATPVAVTTPGSGGSGAAFFCTFPTAPTDCGFRVQEKVPGRASIVGFGRDGGTALRLHTEPGDNNVVNSGDMQRADVYLAHASGAPIVFNEGEEQWWAVSILFPNDFVFPTWQNYNLQGFHHTGSTGSGNFRIGFERGAGLPTTAPGVWVFRGHGGSENQTQFIQPIGVPARNTWYDFVYHVKWSSGSGGFFRAWVNGVKKLDHSGPTLYAGQGAYFKLGNYHTPICDPYPACIGSDPPSSVIYDRVVRGTSPQAVSAGPLQGVLEMVNGVLTQMGGF